jgi:hypothetical protein
VKEISFYPRVQSTVEAANWLSSLAVGGGQLRLVLVTLRPKLQGTYSGIGGEEKGGAQVLKLASDIYRVEVKLIHKSNFRKVSNHAEIYAFRLFVCYLKIVIDIIVLDKDHSGPSH